MQIYIGSAKIMRSGVSLSAGVEMTQPQFQQQADDNAMQMAALPADRLAELLGCNHDIAVETWRRYQSFFDRSTVAPAALSYDGMVFKKLSAETLSADDLAYANSHLIIGSFLYGALRPLDAINRYRLEAGIVASWKPLLTDWLIRQVEADDGLLVNLAANEFRTLVDWRRVERSVDVVSPQFKVSKDGRLKNVTIYAKMCRGAIARWIITSRPADKQALQLFEYEGFEYRPDAPTPWTFVMEG